MGNQMNPREAGCWVVILWLVFVVFAIGMIWIPITNISDSLDDMKPIESYRVIAISILVFVAMLNLNYNIRRIQTIQTIRSYGRSVVRRAYVLQQAKIDDSIGDAIISFVVCFLSIIAILFKLTGGVTWKCEDLFEWITSYFSYIVAVVAWIISCTKKSSFGIYNIATLDRICRLNGNSAEIKARVEKVIRQYNDMADTIPRVNTGTVLSCESPLYDTPTINIYDTYLPVYDDPLWVLIVPMSRVGMQRQQERFKKRYERKLAKRKLKTQK